MKQIANVLVCCGGFYIGLNIQHFDGIAVSIGAVMLMVGLAIGYCSHKSTK